MSRRKPSDLGAARRRKRLLRNARRIALLTAVVAVIVTVFFTPAFEVRQVSAIGMHYASEQDIVAAARIPLGRQLSRLRTSRIHDNVLKLPEIAEVEVRLVWPHEVLLAVVERKPVAVMSLAGTWKYVDAQGVLFGISVGRPEGMPVVAADSVATRAASAAVAGQLPGWLANRVDVVRGVTVDNIRLELTSGDLILWGSAERSARKVKVLKAILAMPAHTYDVSAPDVPVLKGKPAQTRTR